VAEEKVLTNSAAFLVAKLGEKVTARFADRLAPLGIRPRHCALLAILATGSAPQMDLARGLNVTPSVVVDMVDELEALAAVRRVRDAADRRRQVVELTAPGRRLLTRSAALASELDNELLNSLPSDERGMLLTALRQLGSSHGLPGQAKAEHA
jgi:DNA-binding MarR family transcriptional regulator